MNRPYKILIIGEIQEGKPAPATLELIGEGKKTADQLDAELLLVIAGSGIKGICSDLLRYPVDRIIAVDHPRLEPKQMEIHCRALEAVIREQEPDIILGGETLFGRTLLPSLAAVLGTEVITDAAGLKIDRKTGKLLVCKPAYDGKRMSVVSMPESYVQIVSVKPGIFQRADETDVRKGSIIMTESDWLENLKQPKQILGIISEEKQISLEDAKIIVSGGRGLKGPEGFKLLKLFAGRIGAQTGCTRPCVDAGWMPGRQQIGQTGSIVKPDLYLAFGISGAIQHMTGVRARTVIAVNSNPDAAIFQNCDYGIVGDAVKILEELLK
ncbi:electron transfer flavoprotein subunit alpha/FixB family protein [Anaerostipes sp.]|uniref:electron transfer flavoprotein subunit alpha/FixB family protein n=1 Tax=Anaerostipes sp. TaxID=1872530 RepID=UPI0025C6E84F|nr:electron transfer flavoprotein subunit alpha/FixB family protein [Anaerostipes sp.]MBS7009623.1 electron transfer flavoprotein subunit alpha/FixB family protein [Anaerostipes sp.]